MDINPAAIAVTNNIAHDRYEAQMNGEVAFIEYQQSGDRIVFTHTEVPEALEGHGIGARMVQVALEDARARQLAVIPRCPFVASYLRRHPEYLELVPTEYRERYVGQ
jgi:predicted GNAT family acetyltransferase